MEASAFVFEKNGWTAQRIEYQSETNWIAGNDLSQHAMAELFRRYGCALLGPLKRRQKASFALLRHSFAQTRLIRSDGISCDLVGLQINVAHLHDKQI